MANPLKVLTQLTASKEAQFQEVVEAQKTVTISGAEAHLRVSGGGEISGSAALKIGGAAQLGSSLDVKGNSALSGTLGVVGASNLQSTLAVAGVASFASDVTASAGMDVAGAAHIVGAVDMDSTLNVDGAASFQSNISGAANLDIGGNALVVGTLNVDGSVDMDSTLDVAGNITAQASASIAGDLDVDGLADIAGNLDVHGNAVIYGNLEVKGVTTTIESTTVTVADANIQLATVASPTDTTADGAGITILGATNKTFQWNNDGNGFSSSEDMNLASGMAYRLDGSKVLIKESQAGTHYAKLQAEGNSAGNVSVFAEERDGFSVVILGNTNISQNLYASSDLTVDGTALFSGAVTASAGVLVSGSMDVDYEIKLAGETALYRGSGYTRLYDGNNGNSLLEFNNSGYAQVSSSAQVTVAAPDVVIDGAVDINSTLNVDGIASFQAAISGAAGFDLAGAADLGSTLAVAGVASFASDVSASAGLDVAGAAHVVGAVDMDSTLNVDGVASFQSDISGAAGLEIAGVASFQDDVGMDAALNLSGSAFINITTPVVDGKYNVNDAIRALDAKAGQQASNINSNYAALRYLSAANFDANGMAAFTSSFAAADIEQVSVDVLVQAGGSGPWTNDLLSVQVKAAGSYVGFEISAPAMGASDKVRIIAVKESGSLA